MERKVSPPPPPSPWFHGFCLYSIPALDVSADVVELGRTPVAVVCAGVKSILDIGRTLEVLVSSTRG